jgi:hypothetical protein
MVVVADSNTRGASPLVRVAGALTAVGALSRGTDDEGALDPVASSLEAPWLRHRHPVGSHSDRGADHPLDQGPLDGDVVPGRRREGYRQSPARRKALATR